MPMNRNQYSNIHYLNCQGMNFAQRSAIAKSQLKCDYSMILSDDERITSFGSENVIKVLESNPKLSSCAGLVFGVHKFGSITTGQTAYLNMRGYKNPGCDLEQRVHSYFSSQDRDSVPRGGMYRIFRSPHMYKLLELFSLSEFVETPHIFEVIGELFVPISGETSTIEDIYWIRNWETPIVKHSNWNRKLTFSQWWLDTSYSTSKIKWLEIMSASLDLEIAFLNRHIESYLSKRLKIDIKKNQAKGRFISEKQKLRQLLTKMRIGKGNPPEIPTILLSAFPILSEEKIKEIVNLAENMV